MALETKAWVGYLEEVGSSLGQVNVLQYTIYMYFSTFSVQILLKTEKLVEVWFERARCRHHILLSKSLVIVSNHCFFSKKNLKKKLRDKNQ